MPKFTLGLTLGKWPNYENHKVYSLDLCSAQGSNWSLMYPYPLWYLAWFLVNYNLSNFTKKSGSYTIAAHQSLGMSRCCKLWYWTRYYSQNIIAPTAKMIKPWGEEVPKVNDKWFCYNIQLKGTFLLMGF